MHDRHGAHQVLDIMLFFSAAALIASLLTGTPAAAFLGLKTLILTPAQLTMDAFHVGGVSGTFLNVGLVGLACTGVMARSRAKLSGVSLMAFFLTIGFSFFGLNIVNIWPCILGTLLYTKSVRMPFASQVNTALFATSLSPFVSELLLRYPLLDGLPCEGLLRLVLAVFVGVVAGFLMPILCHHSPNLHKGYSLYNAAAVAGYIGVMLYAILYHALNVPVPTNTQIGVSHISEVNTFMIVVCLSAILIGWFLNGRSFRGYRQIIFCSGYRTDFTRTLGIPLTIVHLGVFGLCITLYYNLIGASMTGPTVGSMICLLAIAPCGGHLLNVLPIMLGYALASLVFHFNLTTQSILVGFSFACALCQIAGHFGAISGVVAGFLHASLVATIVNFHAGFCLYNGGFTSGICAIILVPILETYFVPTDRLHLIPQIIHPKDRHLRHGPNSGPHEHHAHSAQPHK